MASSVNPKIMIAISKQINEMVKKKTDGITIIPNQRDILDIQADITGPVDTPYEGGVFRCKLVLDSIFPSAPPKGYFLTKIFHPNVASKGDICVNTLKKDWKPSQWSLQNIFQVIRCLLIIPFPESALNEEAGKMFMENYEEYVKYAKLITQLHAMPKNLPEQPLIKKLFKKSFSAMEQQLNQKVKNQPKRINTFSMNVNQQLNQLDGVKENIQGNPLTCSSNLLNCGSGSGDKFFLEKDNFIESPVKMEMENNAGTDLKQSSNSNTQKNFLLDQLIDNTFEQPVFMDSNQNSNFCNLFANSVNLTKKENEKKKWTRRI